MSPFQQMPECILRLLQCLRYRRDSSLVRYKSAHQDRRTDVLENIQTNQPKRILFVVTILGVGGAELQLVRLATELRARGWRVCVVSLVKFESMEPYAQRPIHQLEQQRIPVLSLDMKRGVPDLGAVFRLRSLIRSFRPDVVHCHMYHANILGRIARLFCRMPVLICTAHNYREASRRGGPTWHKELIYRATDILADYTTIICNAASNRYVRVGAVPRKKLRMIPNGIDTELFAPSKERRQRTRNALGIGSEFVWLAVARLVKAKDYPTLFGALEVLGRKDLVVLIAGTGPLEQELRDACCRRGLSGQVRFLGMREDTFDLYNAADAFVMSSQLEGLPLALLEAASVGLPAAVTDVGGNPEIVVDGVTGYVVPPRDSAQLAAALRQMMEAGPECREAMGHAARQHCQQHYGIAAVMSQWLALYSECLASCPRQSLGGADFGCRRRGRRENRISRLGTEVFSHQPAEVRSVGLPKSKTALGALVISLDFELFWGVRDRFALDQAERGRLLAARAGIPRLLDLFDEFSVHATWATVGLLFARSRQEAEAFWPLERPRYREARLDPYRERLGADEYEDPFHFAPSLIAQIAQRAGQEIASHSFSHYYCMEWGQTEADFAADLKSAVAIAANSGYTLRSYVFPRNEVNPAYLPALERAGIWAYRGNEPVGDKEAAPFSEQRRLDKRAGRLLDSYLDLHGHQTCAWPGRSLPAPILASRYLRSYHPVFCRFEPWLLQRIEKAMKHAAQRGEIFHLWWHPEDFASNYGQNLRVLRRVLEMFAGYRTRYGMVSLNMAEVASRVGVTTLQTSLESINESA